MNVTNQDGYSPLHVAALHGRADLITLLLKHGAYIGASSASQAVPLHLACQKGHFQVWLCLGRESGVVAEGLAWWLVRARAHFSPYSPDSLSCTWWDQDVESQLPSHTVIHFRP